MDVLLFGSDQVLVWAEPTVDVGGPSLALRVFSRRLGLFPRQTSESDDRMESDVTTHTNIVKESMK